MSFCLELSSLSKKTRLEILAKCSIKPKVTLYEPNPEYVRCFLADKKTDTLYLPLGLWKEYLDDFPNENEYPKMNSKIKFEKELYTKETDPKNIGRDQDVVAKSAIKQLKENNVTFIATHTGFGKTGLAIYISIYFKLKTLIICDINTVKDQWPDEYVKYCGKNVKFQRIKGKIEELDKSVDVYIVGIQKAKKLDFDLSSIGTIILDEAHLSSQTLFTESLFKFQPKYLIALTATPDRKDGLDKLFNLYFGEKENFIIRKEKKEFIVYKHQTGIEPVVSKKMFRGRVIDDWQKIVASIERNPVKWDLVADVACKFPNKMIILCYYEDSTIGIYNLLVKRKQHVDYLCGTKKKWDENVRILVAGYKKAGVGFNNPDFTMAIINFDTTDIRQYEGRVRTTNNIIYHFVDKYHTFEKHWRDPNCLHFYLEKGASIKVVGEKYEKSEKFTSKTKNKLSNRKMG